MENFFNDVNDVNIFGFTKSIINTPKLKSDIEENTLIGSKFDFLHAVDDKIKTHFKEALIQTEVDELNSILNNFIEVDVVKSAALAYEQATDEGEDLYRKMIVDINITTGGQGLDASLDESIRKYVGATDVNTMIVSLVGIRCMLKDKFVEYTLRALNTFLDPAIGFTTEQVDRYSSWVELEIQKKMLSDGVDQASIDGLIAALKTAPKGAV